MFGLESNNFIVDQRIRAWLVVVIDDIASSVGDPKLEQVEVLVDDGMRVSLGYWCCTTGLIGQHKLSR
jgi:hypothetical protein